MHDCTQLLSTAAFKLIPSGVCEATASWQHQLLASKFSTRNLPLCAQPAWDKTVHYRVSRNFFALQIARCLACMHADLALNHSELATAGRHMEGPLPVLDKSVHCCDKIVYCVMACNFSALQISIMPSVHACRCVTASL